MVAAADSRSADGDRPRLAPTAIVLSGHGQDLVDLPATRTFCNLSDQFGWQWPAAHRRTQSPFWPKWKWAAEISMRRVVKVGGSLFATRGPAFGVAAVDRASTRKPKRWSSSAAARLIDAIRQLEPCVRGDPVEVHWICVGLLETTFRLFSLNGLTGRALARAEELRAAKPRLVSRTSPTLVAVQRLLRSRANDAM